MIRLHLQRILAMDRAQLDHLDERLCPSCVGELS